MCFRKLFPKTSHKDNKGSQGAAKLCSDTMRKGTSYTVSPGTGYHLFIGNGSLSQSEFEPKPLQQLQLQSSVASPQKPLPPPKKRNSKTLTLRHTNSNGNNNAREREGLNAPSTMGPSSASAMNGHGHGLSNPKRVSVATSSFWDGHPDIGHLVRGWELGLGENTRPGDRSSLWGYTFDPKADKSCGGIGASTDDLQKSSSTLPSSGLGTSSGIGSVAESLNVWGDPPAVKKGILLQQRDKLLARWKERYCILTRDYLHCFRRTSSIHRSSGLRLSEMGNFIFKLRLAEIDEIEWETKRGCSMLSIVLPKEPRIHVRVLGDNEDLLRQWFTLLQECIYTSKERRRALRTMYTMNTGSGSATGTTNTNTMSNMSSVTGDGISRSVSLLSDGDSGESQSPSASSTKPESNSASPKSSTSKMSTTDNNIKDSPRLTQIQYSKLSQVNSNTYDKSKTENKKKYAQLLENGTSNLREEEPSTQQENKVVLRRDLRNNTITGNTRTAEDFLRDNRNNDRESSSSPPQVPMRKSAMGFITSNGNGTVSKGAVAVQLPNGYAIPVDFTCSMMSTTPAPRRVSKALTKTRKAPARPESWAPSHHVISIMDPNPLGGRAPMPNMPNLVPGHHWMNSSRSNMNSCSDYQRLQTGAVAHHRTFSSCASAMIPISATPSIHTSDYIPKDGLGLKNRST